MHGSTYSQSLPASFHRLYGTVTATHPIVGKAAVKWDIDDSTMDVAHGDLSIEHDDVPIPKLPLPSDNVKYSLVDNGTEVFVASLVPSQPGDVVHHAMRSTDRKLVIVSVSDFGDEWDDLDRDVHCPGVFIVWSVRDTREIEEPKDCKESEKAKT